MTIKEQLGGIKEVFDVWAQTSGAFFAIAGDALEQVDLLSSKPGVPKVLICFISETPATGYDELGMVNRVYVITVSRGVAFTINREGNLTGGTNSQPLFDLVEEVREVIRSYQGDPSTEVRPVMYRGTKPFGSSDAVLDAYQIEFAIGTWIPNSLISEETSTFPDES